MNLETKITIYKFTPQVFTLTPKNIPFLTSPGYKNGIYKQNKQQGHLSQTAIVYDKRFYIFSFPTGISSIHLINTVRLSILTVIQLLLLSKPNLCY